MKQCANANASIEEWVELRVNNKISNKSPTSMNDI